MATWAANIIVFAVEPQVAIDRMHAVERALNERWDLEVKDGSCELLLAQGCGQVPVLPPGWTHADETDCLGHRRSADCKASACIAKTMTSCWGSFWRNWNRAVRPQSPRSKGTLFNRAVSSVAEFHMPRWPRQADAAALIQSQPSRMLAAMIGATKAADETWRQWMTRRRHPQQSMNVEPCDSLWAKRSASWLRHLARHPTNLASAGDGRNFGS